LSENENPFRQCPWTVLAALSLLAAGAFAEDKKKDPRRFGDRDVGKGVNFLLPREGDRHLGKQLAQEVERQAKISTTRSSRST